MMDELDEAWEREYRKAHPSAILVPARPPFWGVNHPSTRHWSKRWFKADIVTEGEGIDDSRSLKP